MAEKVFPERFRDLDHLAAVLADLFPQRCIGEKESKVAAQRYAGAAQLALRIRRTIEAPSMADSDVEVEIS